MSREILFRILMSRHLIHILLLFLLVSFLFVLPCTADLPSSYDLRTLNLTPEIMNQGIYEICWAYASIASLESSMIMQDPEKYSGIGLSPYHLAYFTYNRNDISDPDSPFPGLEGIAGDYTYCDKANLSGNSSSLVYGGYEFQGMYTLASWIGAVNESAVCFDSYGDSFPLPADLSTSANEIQLRSAAIIPPEDTSTIKTMLMENGSGTFGFYLDAEDPYINGLGNGEWAYYHGSGDEGKTYTSNHAVLLIGWDDTFPKENFNMTPEHDGAWLIQNSWGSGAANGTYIWISYDEPYIDNLLFFQGEEPVYDHNYQYDGGTLLNVYPTNQTGVSIGNVFTAGGDELIRAVSLDTNQSVTYTLGIYTDPEEGIPDSGNLLASATGHLDHRGYYTIELEDPVPIEEGQTFSVVYSLTSDDPLNISIDRSILLKEDLIETVTLAKPGQSYLLDGPVWTDLSADKETNLRIKAFTTDTVFTVSIDPVTSYLGSRPVTVSGTTTFAPGSELNVTLTCPDGSRIFKTAVVSGGTWNVTFSGMQFLEKEYTVTAERKSVQTTDTFVPVGLISFLTPGIAVSA